MVICGRRRFLVPILAIALVGASGCGSQSKRSDDTTVTFVAPSNTLPPVPPSTARPPRSCVLQAILDGVPSEQIDARCALDRLIDDIIANLRVRESIADNFNDVRPGWGDAAFVAKWADYTCKTGPSAIGELVEQVTPGAGNGQRWWLLSPLTDFAALVADGCPLARSSLRDELSAAAWTAVMGDTATYAQIRSTLTRYNSGSVLAEELFKEAHGLCDVVGNGGVLLLESVSATNLPKWADLALGFAVGKGCEALIPE